MQIIQGKRPNIPPFTSTTQDGNTNDMLISEFFYKSNELDSMISEREISEIVIKFFQLCVSCWSQNPMERPSFDIITESLKEMQALFEAY